MKVEARLERDAPGAAVGAAANRATRDKMQRRILRVDRKDRKRHCQTEPVDIARRFGSLNLHVVLGHLDPLLWGPKLLGWSFTPAQRAGMAVWYVHPAWSSVAVRAGLDADVREWLRPRPAETLGAWYARVRHHLADLAAEQAAAHHDREGQ